MKAISKHMGKVLPLDIANVDTDAIIPKQFLKSIYRTGFGPHLFDEWRYLDKVEYGADCSKRPKNEKFIMNNPIYNDASILLTRENFGCGSSREHAPWAILEAGFRIIISNSFADIFFSNCIKNGILPINLSVNMIDLLFEKSKPPQLLKLVVDLKKQTITSDENKIDINFEIEPENKNCLILGLDEIELTLKYKKNILLFEENRFKKYPWLKIDPQERLK